MILYGNYSEFYLLKPKQTFLITDVTVMHFYEGAKVLESRNMTNVSLYNQPNISNENNI